MRRLILRLLNWIFRLRGMELRALTPPLADSGMAAGLARAAALVRSIGTVIDVGAAAGKWTRLARPNFPKARFLLVEALRERVPELEQLAREDPQTGFVCAAAGAAVGEVSFYVADDLDGSGVSVSPGRPGRTVPVTTLDREVALRGLPGPYLIKLDTHGFELPILEGAASTLRDADLLVIEAYNFHIAPGSLRFHELCAWLGERGFRPCDLLDPLRRAGDGLLWQLDLVFARADHPAFSRATYQ